MNHLSKNEQGEIKMEVEHISTIDRLKVTRDMAELYGNDFIVQNLDIAIKDLEELKQEVFKSVNAPKPFLNVVESTFKEVHNA